MGKNSINFNYFFNENFQKLPNISERKFFSFYFPRRIIYVLHHCYPFSSNGYAVRSHGIAKGLVNSGYEVIAVSRPGVSWEKSGFTDKKSPINHIIDGVNYVHHKYPFRKGNTLEEYLKESVAIYEEMIQVFKPAVVMAASNWINAFPAALAARSSGIPFFYEIRGFWEWSRAAREPGYENTIDFVKNVEGEMAVANAAQRIFTLNRWMREELVQRGVKEPIDLVPNGFPGWVPASKNPILPQDLGISSHHIIGYVGSFNIYEGLEELIEALALLRKRGLDVSLLLVGSGQPNGFDISESFNCSKTTSYRKLAKKLGVNRFVFTPGRVRVDKIAAYYELLDVVVIPRRSFKVCELVSPMKPLEAISHGKPVLLSDVAPLKDLEGLCQGFNYFSKGSVESLAKKLKEILEEKKSFLPQKSKALDNFSWENNVKPMVAAIKALS